MTILEILGEFYISVSNGTIDSFDANGFSCYHVATPCDFCTFLKSCSWLGDGDQSTDTNFGKLIYPLLDKEEYSLKSLQANHPELFI